MASWSVIGRFACGVVFEATRPAPKAATLLQAEQKLITFGMIGAYLEKTGAHNGRLRFFEAHYPASPFYQHVAKRLLSMRNRLDKRGARSEADEELHHDQDAQQT